MVNLPATHFDQALSRRFWSLALPLIFSNVSIAILGLVDTSVSGHLPGAHYLGGVALGGTVFSFLYWGFNFLRMGTSGLAAQASGRDDPAAIRATLLQGLMLAALCALVLLLLQQPIIDFFMRLFAPGPAVADQARLYFSVRIWATPAALANFVILGWFIGLRQGRAALYLLVMVNTVNTLLDLWFVLGLKWGVAGVAAASVAGEFAGLLLAAKMLSGTLRRYPGGWELSSALERAGMVKLFHTHRHLFVRTMALLAVFSFVNARSAQLGDTVIAATAVLMNFYLLASFALDGLANAAEALAGEAVGAENKAYFQRVVLMVLAWGSLVALLFSLTYLSVGDSLYRLMTDLQPVRALLADLLPWAVILPLVSVYGFLFDGIFTGSTWTRQMRDTVVLSALVVFLPVWWLTQDWGVHGLWMAFVLFNLSRGLSLGWLLWRRLKFPDWLMAADHQRLR